MQLKLQDRLHQVLNQLSVDEASEILYDWEIWARDAQLIPPGTWQKWIILAGRGFGKTRVGAETVIRKTYAGEWGRVALVAEDSGDARDVMVEGEAGIIACSPPWHKARYHAQQRRVTWPNGAMATIYSDADPESLRGPAHDGAWVDELAKYRHAGVVWSNLMFGLRIGMNPQVVVTTTPKPVPIIRDLVKESNKKPESVIITRGSTYENRANLPDVFYDEIIKEYEGTTLGRQELNGELIDPEEAGIIKRSWFKLWPKDKPIPKLHFVLQSYDTAFTERSYDKETKDPDYTACFTFGVFDHPDPKEQARGRYAVLVLDCWQEQMGYPNLKKRAYEEFNRTKFGPKNHERRIDEVVIEDKGSGISLRQDMQADDIPVFPYNPGRTDKTQRLHLTSPICRDGLIYWPESEKNPGEPRTWCQGAMEQICSFPLVEHDDFVDAFSQAVRRLRDLGYLKAIIDDEREVRLREAALEEKDAWKPKRGNPYTT